MIATTLLFQRLEIELPFIPGTGDKLQGIELGSHFPLLQVLVIVNYHPLSQEFEMGSHLPLF